MALREKFDADSLSVQELSQKCASLQTLFIDAEFPPNETALVSPKSESKPKLVQWRRAREFLGEQVAVFKDGVDPSDIQQGELGDCWLDESRLYSFEIKFNDPISGFFVPSQLLLSLRMR